MFSVPSAGAFARSVLRTLIDPNTRGVSAETHFHPCYTQQLPTRDVTSCGVGTSCGGVILGRVTWYWTGSRYPGTQIRRKDLKNVN